MKDKLESTQTIIAIEQDGVNARAIAITCIILNKDKNFDLREAVKAAVKDYLHTEDGKRTYEYNCGYFDWGDFEVNVPNKICEKHGFRKIKTLFDNIDVDWNEQLVDNNDFEKFWNIQES